MLHARYIIGKVSPRLANSYKDENMSKELSSSAQKVQNMLYALGFSSRVVELPDSTRTAKEAAQAIGCQVAQIVKSLVFRGKHSKQAAARSCQWHKSRERAAFEGSHG